MLTWLATSGLKTKRIVHLHVTPDFLYSGALKHRLRQRLAANILRRAWRVIAVSYAVRVHWCEALGLPLDRIIVVHNGVDTRRFSPRSPDADVIHSRLVIGVAARLAPMKGLDVLIRAISLLRKRGVEADLRIAGDGGLRSALEALSREIGVADCVRFLGQIDDMSEFYHGLDLFVLPSVAMEGLPLGILEAMASGLPVVATRVAGAPEAVEDGVEGLLVPPGDEEALADAIARLAGDSMLRARMGINGRRRAEESFSLVAFADRMAAVYFGGR